MTIRHIWWAAPTLTLVLTGCGLSEKKYSDVRIINGCIVDYKGAEIEENVKGQDTVTVTKDCEVTVNQD